MSEKRARAERKAIAGADLRVRNANAAIATAQRMLALDLTHIPLDRSTQVIVGWMRSAFEQSRVIATLALSGLSHAGAPNRRAFAETVVRIQWLLAVPQPDRAGAVDELIAKDREETKKALAHLSDMGYESTADLREMEAILLDVTEKGPLRNETRAFVAAAKATHGQSVGLYYAWREETQYTHATSILAVAHAPERDGVIGTGRPPVADPDLAAHRLATALAVAYVYRFLVEEGVPEDRAMPVMNAFFDAH